MFDNLNTRGLSGLVLVGGQSARMKQAKAHLVINGVPQWHYCEQVIGEFCATVYFSVSRKLFPPLKVEAVRVIEDIFVEPIGPLGGIISAFKMHPRSAFFVLACDLPHFDRSAAHYLLERRNPDKKATVFVHDGKIEPLCGIYEPAIFDDLLKFWAAGKFCPRAILSELDVVKVQPINEKWLTNINYDHELAKLMDIKEQRSVRVHFYASLREDVGHAEEEIITAQKTVGELFSELQIRYGLKTPLLQMRFALNNRLVIRDAAICDKDTIVFIPPVSGG